LKNQKKVFIIRMLCQVFNHFTDLPDNNYFFYKNFFRLTYSTGRIFKNIGELTNSETEFVTRILFYNNGLKTITNDDIQKLELISSEKINSLKEIKGNENISIVTNIDKATIEIDFIDSSDFFILEVNHTGDLVC